MHMVLIKHHCNVIIKIIADGDCFLRKKRMRLSRSLFITRKLNPLRYKREKIILLQFSGEVFIFYVLLFFENHFISRCKTSQSCIKQHLENNRNSFYI